MSAEPDPMKELETYMHPLVGKRVRIGGYEPVYAPDSQSVFTGHRWVVTEGLWSEPL
jgi:hypothetical protein